MSLAQVKEFIALPTSIFLSASLLAEISQVPALGSAMMLLPPIDSANGLVSLNKTFLSLVLSGHCISSQQQNATITVAVSDNPCLGNYRILTK